MNKQEIFKSYVSKFKTDANGVYLNNEIPEKTLEKAIKKYAKNLKKEEIIGMVDTSLIGSSGYIFTEKEIYMSQIGFDSSCVVIDKIMSMKFIYNKKMEIENLEIVDPKKIFSILNIDINSIYLSEFINEMRGDNKIVCTDNKEEIVKKIEKDNKKKEDVEKNIKAAMEGINDFANKAISKSKDVYKDSKELLTEKKDLIYKNVESFQPIVNVVNEASIALNDKSRTIKESAIPEVISGAVGAGVGGIVSFGALYGLGTVGLSAAGITSGLATAGAIVGGGMVAGVFVLAAPVAILGGTSAVVAAKLKQKQLRQERERLYKVALEKHQAIIEALKNESDANKERLDYLQGLNVLLKKAVEDLKADMEKDSNEK